MYNFNISYGVFGKSRGCFFKLVLPKRGDKKIKPHAFGGFPGDPVNAITPTPPYSWNTNFWGIFNKINLYKQYDDWWLGIGANDLGSGGLFCYQ